MNRNTFFFTLIFISIIVLVMLNLALDHFYPACRYMEYSVGEK